MKQDIQITPEKVAQLIALFRNLPKQPIGEHLSDDEFVGYAAEALTDEETQRVDIHLGSCPDCAKQMEKLLEISLAWHGEQGKQRLAALRERVLAAMGAPQPLSMAPLQQVRQALQQMTQSLRAAFAQSQLVLAASPQEEHREIWKWESDDHSSSAHAVLKPNGDLTFRVAFRDLALEGRRIRLRCGPPGHILEREAVLERRSQTQVGAKIEILAYERPPTITDISIDFVE